MFLVSHSPEMRVNLIQRWLHDYPSMSLVISAVYFEWTVCRAIIALSRRPNIQVWQDLSKVFGLDRYEKFWRSELSHLAEFCNLPEVVGNWKGVKDAFEARNKLVHGRDRHTRKMATPLVEALLTAVEHIRVHCLRLGADINKSLPKRRRK